MIFFFVTIKFVLQTSKRKSKERPKKNKGSGKSGLPAASGEAATQVRPLGAGSVCFVFHRFVFDFVGSKCDTRSLATG